MAKIDEIAPDLFRISVFVPEIDLQFNHFVVRDEEPLLFHTGMRRMFPAVREAVAQIIDPASLRWISWSHFEVDECGALNEWLAEAPEAQPVCTEVGALVNLNDFSNRPPRGLRPDETIDTGRHRYRLIPTPHLPHGWDAGVMYEESTGTLLSGDLFTQSGDNPPLIHGGDIIGPAIQGEEIFQYSALNPEMGVTIRNLAKLAPKTLALMHGPSFAGDGKAALNALADFYENRTASRRLQIIETQAKAA